MSSARVRASAVVCVASMAVVGCGGARPARSQPPTVLPVTNVVGTAPSAKPGVAPEAGAATASIIADALREASKIRELPATSTVRGVALSRAEMAAHVEATIQREVPAEAVADEGEVLIALGVAPPGFDYVRATVILTLHEVR